MKKSTLFTLLFALIGFAVMSVSKATPIEKDKSEIVAKVVKVTPAIAVLEADVCLNYSDNSSPVIFKAEKAVRNSRVYLVAELPEVRNFCRSHWRYFDNGKSNYISNLSRNKVKPVKVIINVDNPPKIC